MTTGVLFLIAMRAVVAAAEPASLAPLRVNEAVVYDSNRHQFLVAGTEFRVLGGKDGHVIWRVPLRADRLSVAQGRAWLPQTVGTSKVMFSALEVRHVGVAATCDATFEVHPDANTLRVDVFERNGKTWARWLSFRDEPHGGAVPTRATQEQAQKRYLESLRGGVLELRIDGERCLATPGSAEEAGVADSIARGRPYSDLPTEPVLPSDGWPRAVIETQSTGSQGPERWMRSDALVVTPDERGAPWRTVFRKYRVMPPRP